MAIPTLYHVDRFGAFDGDTSLARRSPADEAEVWLIPEGATLEAPPITADDEVAMLRSGQWFVLPNLRGRIAYDKATHTPREIDAPGGLGENETLQPPPSSRHVWTEGGWALPFADAKAFRVAEVGAELTRRNSAGFTYEGVVYQLDDVSQARITSLVLLATINEGANWPEEFAFIAADNSSVPFTASAFSTFGAAAALVVTKRRLNARALKGAILTAADAVALEAIDLTVGWD